MNRNMKIIQCPVKILKLFSYSYIFAIKVKSYSILFFGIKTVTEIKFTPIQFKKKLLNYILVYTISTARDVTLE